jgi:signal transduction histidine kinase
MGIRLQLLVALGVLLAVAFVPLWLAVSSLTSATLRSVQTDGARDAGHVLVTELAAIAGPTGGLPEDTGLLVGDDGTGPRALGLYDGDGTRLDARGEPARLPERWEGSLHDVRSADGGDALLVGARDPTSGRSVVVAWKLGESATLAAPLLRLVALYTGIVALGLLTFAYLAMTRLVVRPVDDLAHGARRVAAGARTLETSTGGARELVELGASLRAMTERLRDEERELREKLEELERTTRELASAQATVIRSEKLASVGRMAAGMAHEIGNPIAAILGLLELLEMPDLSEEERLDFVRRCKRETERVHRVLRDLLDFARPRPEGDGPTSGSVGEGASVASAIEAVVGLTRPQKSMKNVRLELAVDEGLPKLRIGEEKLVQVLLNLVLNAADALEHEGSVVALRARSSGACVRIEVEDDGPGVPSSIRARLFEPFATSKDVGRGTGLGLAVCRGLVEGAGGSITHEEVSPHGARFVIELPALASG